MTKKPLKLFVWENVLTDYTSGIAFALAPDIETARRLILKVEPHTDLKGKPNVHKGRAAYALWGGG